ncbi:uncharacterized protein OCT59_018884 [Rhizophagus irregularis]|uniref:uncharacterized protein n=1 Tax=Rhizophagus irregularis TaxID=588596 RepID=UPI0033344C05|nr:hypothetical protein OCT59_018884 [Rhizophagus irregularis]
MVIKDNQEPVRLKFHIGDIVDLNEKSKGDELLHVAPSMMRLIERNSFKNQVVDEFIGGNFNLNRNFYHTIIILFYYF